MNKKYESPAANIFMIKFENEISQSIFEESNDRDITTTLPDGVFDIIV